MPSCWLAGTPSGPWRPEPCGTGLPATAEPRTASRRRLAKGPPPASMDRGGNQFPVYVHKLLVQLGSILPALRKRKAGARAFADGKD